MILPPAPPTYSQADQEQVRDALRRADRDALRRGRDIELVGERLILTSPDGSQFVLTVADDGTLSAVAL